MDHDFGLIVTLAAGLTAALIFGGLTQRLRLSPIVGYLVAGIVIGPFTPGLVVDRHIAEQFAELGVILLMFGVGLHFHVGDLIKVRNIALPGAIVQSAIATALGTLAAMAFGWSIGAGVVYGIAISVASTVVLIRVLSDHDTLHTQAGHIAVGWLLVEDLFTVLVLVLLPAIAAGAGGSAGEVALSLGLALLKIGLLVLFTFVVGRRAIPMLLRWIAKTRSRELFTLTVLALALGIAVGSAELFGASMALGAFLAGLVVGQSEFSARAMSEALPMRDAFAVLFFVAMGMLLDPTALLDNAALSAVTLAIVVLGKPLAAIGVVLLLRYPLRTALQVAVALAQIGEFSFIVAQLGLGLEIVPEAAMQALVAASIVSITLNPFLYRFIDPLLRRIQDRRPAGAEGEPEPARPEDPAHRALVVGYGPVGRTLVRLLREQGIAPTVIELNVETIDALRAEGIDAVYGDASQASILEAAGVKSAGSLVFAASGSPQPVVAVARELNPSIAIIARATYVAEARALHGTGIETVVAAEAEVALAMAEQLLDRLGATRDQLDRTRDQVRAELVGPRSSEAAAGAQ